MRDEKLLSELLQRVASKSSGRHWVAADKLR
jgi:hypothetical protein